MTAASPTPRPQDRPARLFLAWQPDDATRAALADVRDTLAAQRRDPGHRWTPTPNLHLTLRFLGDTPRDREAALRERVAALAAATPATTARAAGWQYWPDRRAPRVLVLRLESAGALERLGNALEALARDCGFAPERKPFRAHLTLARIGRLRAPVEPLLAPPPPLALAIDHVVLNESTLRPDGASYVERARWPLRL